ALTSPRLPGTDTPRETKRQREMNEEEWKQKLAKEEYDVLRLKHTEPRGSGQYNHCTTPVTYKCAGCGSELYHSTDKFASSCGWPAFEDSIPGAVKEVMDSDGIRTEILCSKWDGHLGHAFRGEGYTDKNVRHCVNSIALKLTPPSLKPPTPSLSSSSTS